MALVSLSSYTEEFGRSVQLPKCNTESCTEKFAPCFNRGNKTYYCVHCASNINLANPEVKLVEIPDELTAMFKKFEAGEQYVGTTTLDMHPNLVLTGWKTSGQDTELSEAIRDILLETIEVEPEDGAVFRKLARWKGQKEERALLQASLDIFGERHMAVMAHILRSGRRQYNRRKKAARARTGRK